MSCITIYLLFIISGILTQNKEIWCPVFLKTENTMGGFGKEESPLPSTAVI